MFEPSIEFGVSHPPQPKNEAVRDYAPGSPDRAAIAVALEALPRASIDMPMVIDGKDVFTGRHETAVMPHRHAHILGKAHLAGPNEVEAAIAAANRVRLDWSMRSATERASVFLKAAELLAGPWRSTLNAATMLGQSKTVHQAEIDAAAELIDFWRFNVADMVRLYEEQPMSSPGIWNRMDYRPLEGFVFAVTPFNFTAIAGNLPTAPALMGNTVLWKPSAAAKYSAHFLMKLLRDAGLPDGVINLVYGDGREVAKVALAHPTFAGLHFTGSTSVFNGLYQSASARLDTYRGYPRLVGETGGKNFVLAHSSADVDALAVAIIRGGFEYQGQKCSAASRVFVPQSLWMSLRARLIDQIATIPMGDVADLRNFMGSVIDEKAWDKHSEAVAFARSDPEHKVLAGGQTDKREGYFVAPTLIETANPQSRLMMEELFGPIVTVFVYPDVRFGDILTLIDQSGRYGLTGSIFATDRKIIAWASTALRHAAGNFYINDKPTGAVVGQQPFGGARASGTNDKAGSIWNLIRWTSPRAIKETFVPPRDYRYAYMAEREPGQPG